MVKGSRLDESEKILSEKIKKGLTNGAGSGNICKLSDESPLRGPEGSQTAKNLEKREKNLLTI